MLLASSDSSTVLIGVITGVVVGAILYFLGSIWRRVHVTSRRVVDSLDDLSAFTNAFRKLTEAGDGVREELEHLAAVFRVQRQSGEVEEVSTYLSGFRHEMANMHVKVDEIYRAVQVIREWTAGH